MPDEGIPIPEVIFGGGNRSQSDVRQKTLQEMKQMNVGSSFFMAAETVKERKYIRSHADHHRRSNSLFAGWKISSRAVGENGTVGIRIWRIA